MTVRLLKGSKEGQPGEIIEVSPERFAFLLSIEAAEPVKEEREQPKAPEKPAEKKTVTKKTAKAAKGSK